MSLERLLMQAGAINDRDAALKKIEHVLPDSPDDLDHLRPFHRDNALSRGVGEAHCRVTADREGVAPAAHIDLPRKKKVR